VGLVERITEFLNGIGVPCRAGTLPDTTFMPGITIDHGTIVFDPSRLLFPGDLLHEAGHLAVMPPERRCKAHHSAGKSAAEEMMAIAWSYAASVHLQLDPAVVFHDGGYRDGGASLIDNFTHGRYIGVPTLQWLGMTVDAKRAKEEGVAPYPAMQKWVNDQSRRRDDA
jgi:hypothetical protein